MTGQDEASRLYPERPLLGVSVALWRNGKVLLVRRGRAPLAGCWSLPGGLVRPGETMAAAARRELGEETSLECTELSGPVDWNESILKDAAGAAERHYVIAAFTGHWQGGEAIAGDDAADVRWCEAGELAALELAPGTRGAIAKAARQIS